MEGDLPTSDSRAERPPLSRHPSTHTRLTDADLDALAARNVVPHLPAELARVPRANVAFLMIENAWFSGSMNYLGRARKPDGSPEYEATYELNASLQISRPEFAQLVSHEVVPGHVGHVREGVPEGGGTAHGARLGDGGTVDA